MKEQTDGKARVLKREGNMSIYLGLPKKFGRRQKIEWEHFNCHEEVFLGVCVSYNVS